MARTHAHLLTDQPSAAGRQTSEIGVNHAVNLTWLTAWRRRLMSVEEKRAAQHAHRVSHNNFIKTELIIPATITTTIPSGFPFPFWTSWSWCYLLVIPIFHQHQHFVWQEYKPVCLEQPTGRRMMMMMVWSCSTEEWRSDNRSSWFSQSVSQRWRTGRQPRWHWRVVSCIKHFHGLFPSACEHVLCVSVFGNIETEHGFFVFKFYELTELKTKIQSDPLDVHYTFKVAYPLNLRS